MPDRDELELIRKHFGYLFDDYGFVITNVEYFEHFSNWATILASDKCRLRFEEDRGSILVSVGPVVNKPESSAGPWFGLKVTIAYLNHGSSAFDYNPMGPIEPQLERLAGILRPYTAQICEMFSPESYAEHAEGLQALWNKWYGCYVRPK